MELQSLRKHKGISLYRMAQDTGINISTLWRYERGDFKPGVKNIIKISNYLEVTTDELIK